MRRKGFGEVHGSRAWRSFTSSLSQNDLWDPSFSKRKSLQNRTNQNSKKLATADLCQGRELDYKRCFFRSGGERRKTNKKISPRGCSEAPQFGPQNACVCKLEDLTLKLLSGSGSGSGGGDGGGACMCVETETR